MRKVFEIEMCRRSVRVYRRVRAVELNRFGVLFDGLKFLKERRKEGSVVVVSVSVFDEKATT